MDGKPTDRVYLLPLEIKLKHSTIHLDDPCPFLAPNPGVATIHEYAAWASEASEDAEEEEEGEGLGKERWEESGMAPAARIFPSQELCGGGRQKGRGGRWASFLALEPENKGPLPRGQDTGKSSLLFPTGHSSKSCRTAVPNLSGSVEGRGRGRGWLSAHAQHLCKWCFARPGSQRASSGPGVVEYEEDGLDGDP